MSTIPSNSPPALPSKKPIDVKASTESLELVGSGDPTGVASVVHNIAPGATITTYDISPKSNELVESSNPTGVASVAHNIAPEATITTYSIFPLNIGTTPTASALVAWNIEARKKAGLPPLTPQELDEALAKTPKDMIAIAEILERLSEAVDEGKRSIKLPSEAVNTNITATP